MIDTFAGIRHHFNIAPTFLWGRQITPATNGYSINGTTNAFGNNSNNNLTGNIVRLTNDFVYGGNPQTIGLNNLLMGQQYVTTFYNVGFGDAGGYSRRPVGAKTDLPN